METSVKVLIVGGTASLAYGFLLGIPLSLARMKAPEGPRHLVIAHLAAIIQGAMLLALSLAAAFSTLSSRIETLGASLLVAGCVLFVSGAVANWRQGVGDHFAQRSLGWKLLGASGGLNLGGIGIMLVGVLTSL